MTPAIDKTRVFPLLTFVSITVIAPETYNRRLSRTNWMVERHIPFIFL